MIFWSRVFCFFFLSSWLMPILDIWIYNCASHQICIVLLCEAPYFYQYSLCQFLDLTNTIHTLLVRFFYFLIICENCLCGFFLFLWHVSMYCIYSRKQHPFGQFFILSKFPNIFQSKHFLQPWSIFLLCLYCAQWVFPYRDQVGLVGPSTGTPDVARLIWIYTCWLKKYEERIVTPCGCHWRYIK